MNEKLKIIAIAAMDEARVIGRANGLPWNIPEDAKRFAKLTKGHAVLMGRKTYDSLPPRFKPLPGRKNIVITRDPASLAGEPGIEVWSSPESCIEACRSGALELPSPIVWIAGGEQIYRQTMPQWDAVELTLVRGQHEGDAFFPHFEAQFELTAREDLPGFSYLAYQKRAAAD